MNNSIVKIDADNYPLFDDMIFWRENGYERTPSGQPVSEHIKDICAASDVKLSHHDWYALYLAAGKYLP